MLMIPDRRLSVPYLLRHGLFHALSYPTLPNPTLPYPALSYPILSYPTLPSPILPYPIISYPILSYPTLPCPTIAYPTLCPWETGVGWLVTGASWDRRDMSICNRSKTSYIGDTHSHFYLTTEIQHLPDRMLSPINMSECLVPKVVSFIANNLS